MKTRDWKKEYWNNLERERAKNREKYWENRDAILSKKRELAKTKEFKQARRERSKTEWNKLKLDPTYRLIKSIRSKVSLLTKGVRGSLRYLDFSKEQLKAHLESKFKPGMTWENYGRGGWHIDHIIPIKYKTSDGSYYWNQADLANPNSETFKKVWNLENLQPLWETENLSKRNNVG